MFLQEVLAFPEWKESVLVAEAEAIAAQDSKGSEAVFYIYRYARFERIKQPAQKNQKWYSIPFKYQYHSQTINQTLT